MKTKILCISDSNKHFDTAIWEYIKRLGKNIEIIDIKPTKIGSKSQIIQKDTENILKKLNNDNHYKVLLSLQWQDISTMWFVRIVNKNNPITFIIWWPYGLDEDMLGEMINLKLKFGDITLPHGLAKLVVIEQIYRSWMISQNKDYHY